MKFTVEKGMEMEALERFLSPVEAFCQEKARKRQYDDWVDRFMEERK